MKKGYGFLTGAAVVTLLAVGCQKQTKYTVATGSFPANALKESNSAPVLTYATKSDTAVIFTWAAANFGQQLAVSYTVQIDIASDTAGGWAHATNLSAGSAVYSYGMAVQDLNTDVVALGLPVGSPGVIVARVRASVTDISSGATSAEIPAVYTNVVSLTLTPYSLGLYVPNSSYGWNFAHAPALNLVPDSSGKYEGYVYLPGTGTQSFKYTNAPNFLGVDYGTNGGGNLVATTGTDSAMTVAAAGYYEVTANLNTNVYTATKTTWSVIGDATPNGWTAANADIEMTYDSTRQVWYVDSLSLSTGGSFKFRANDAWVIDFGINAAGQLTYADNPFFAYNSTLSNLTVAVTGIYNVVLDLHISGQYTYTLTKL